MTFTHSDKIDRVVTNRWLALPIFAFVMWLVYYLSIQTVGTMGTDWLNDVFWGMGSSICGKLVGAMASSAMDAKFNFRWDHCRCWGGVRIFTTTGRPVFMFRFLEDCGYMARIAFVMDRLFRKFGLSGKSFIPMLIATGCGVPGVMASRTIENERDRRMTIMVTTLCHVQRSCQLSL